MRHCSGARAVPQQRFADHSRRKGLTIHTLSAVVERAVHIDSPTHTISIATHRAPGWNRNVTGMAIRVFLPRIIMNKGEIR